MGLVTLTTDFGTRGFYLAALKGTIFSHCGNIPIVDISHSVKPFDIKEAAYLVRNAYRYFPQETIHLIHVNATDGKNKLLVAEVDKHFFIAFDNGLFSILFEQTPHQIYQVNEELLESNSLLYDEGITKVISLLDKEYKPTDFGHLATDMVKYRLLQPICNAGSIRGTITYFDDYGNAITNITKKMFAEFIGDKKFTISANIGRTNAICQKYNDFDEGDMICLFNASGYLEVALNKGKAESLMGLKIDMPVMITTD